MGSTPAGVITLNGIEAAAGATTATVTKVRLDGGGGDDILRLDETNHPLPPGDLTGGDGNDQLLGGSSDDTLDGGPGIDTITGLAGVDTIFGGPGNDKVNGGPGATSSPWARVQTSSRSTPATVAITSTATAGRTR